MATPSGRQLVDWLGHANARTVRSIQGREYYVRIDTVDYSVDPGVATRQPLARRLGTYKHF
jgi:hypothetical protein